MKKLIIICGLLVALAGASSCKTTVATRPSGPDVVVVRPPQPGPNHIWIDGDWYASGGRYQQRPGHWVVAKKGRAWAPGQWQKGGKGWYWQKGHWR